MDSAGQSALELVIAIAFIMLVFIILLFSYQLKLVESNELKMVMDGKGICKSVATNVDTIAEQGPSYYLYFTVPSRVEGGHDYNITITKNFVDITWYRFSWTEQVITSNVTLHCLDKGETVRNKILNDDGRILLLCNRPELSPVGGSFGPLTARTNETLNVSMGVENFGVTGAGSFTVRFNAESTSLPGLGSDEKATAMGELTMPNSSQNYTVRVSIDYNDEVNESIESNNVYNGTIKVQ